MSSKQPVLHGLGVAAVVAAAAYYVAKSSRTTRKAAKLVAEFDKEYSATSKSVYLKAALDEGVPGPEHFEIRSEPLKVTLDQNAATDLKEGDIVIKVMAMSADPYLRGQIKSTNGLSGTSNNLSGPTPMSGFIAGKVLASRNPKWVAGDLIGAALPFTTIQVVSAKGLASTMSWKLTGVVTEENISLGVGALGMPGATAYGGLIDVLKPKEGETLFVSSAAGAVGSLVGQIAKHVYKCKVVGSCGGPQKNAHIKNKYGFDHAIDYKALTASDGDAGLGELNTKLKEAAPDGVDMYFENVGGIHFDAAMAALRRFGRIAVCGCISGYNSAQGPKNSVYIGQMIYSFQRIEGFVCHPWLSGAQGNFLEDMSGWLKEGKVKADETFFEGVANWPVAFQSLFKDTGRKLGKVVIRMQEGDYGNEVCL